MRLRFPALVLLLGVLPGSALLSAAYLGSATAAPIKAKTSPAPPAASGARILLSPSQRKEASGAGGFLRTPRSLLRVSKQMEYGDFLWNDNRVPAGPIWVRIDLRTQILSVFRGNDEIGAAVILYGADSKETPLGRFPILWKGKNHRSSLYDAEMPYTLRLTGDGVAIHGSDVRWGAATHGCVGVPTDFASKLFAVAKIGDPVVIMRSKKPA